MKKTLVAKKGSQPELGATRALCRIYLMLGFSNRLISTRTGLSTWQIQKVVKEEEVKRVDYRDGTSRLAKAIVNRANDLADRQLLQHLERHLLK